MPLLLSLLFIAASTSAEAREETYLTSITGVRFGEGEAVESFSVKTWGVRFKAVCRIPRDWEITAGSFGPGGRLVGKAGHGATMLRQPTLPELNWFALIELSGPVQRHIKGAVPATFLGWAQINVRGERSRRVGLTYANIRLSRATRCP